jgi:LuxR family maltose regulon positive regulatory protein
MQPTTTQCGSGGTLLQPWTGRAGIAERVSPLLGPPAPPTLEGLVTALVNELDAEPSEAEVLLVLDDYHLIDAQTVHASLEFRLTTCHWACTW